MRVLRATFVQNYAASLANLPQLTREFAKFWQELDKAADDSTERFMAFAVSAVWMAVNAQGTAKQR
jgi:hypothetical protein